MKRLLALLLLLPTSALAQFTAPGINITERPAPKATYAVARTVTVQPARPVAVVQPGRSTAILAFSLLSPVDTQLTVRSNDARLVSAGDRLVPITLGAYAERTVNFVALAPHKGTLTVLNAEGAVLATVPYEVAPAKSVNQGLNLNYSPTSNRVGVSYSISGVPVSPLDPRWNASVSTSVNMETGAMNSNISLGINW